MAIDVRLPSITGPSDSQRITQITRYLYQLAEDLKYNLNTLEAGTSDMASVERIGVLDALDDWKLTAQTSIATIRQKVSSQGASIALLTEWRGSVEDDILSVASIEQRVTDAEAAIKLLTELNMGDTSSLAELVNRVTATEASIASLTSWKNGAVGSITKIEQISTEDYSSITGLAKFRSDTAANEARIEGKADRNGASISTLAEWKNSVSSDVSSISGIRATANANAASLVGLSEFKTTTSTSLARIEGKADKNGASISTLAEWKDSVSSDVSSISGIRATANANAASLVGLSEFKTNTTTSLARIEGKADTNGASIGLVVDNGKVKGGVLVEAINNESAAKISADRLDIEGKTLNINVASTNIVGSLTIGQLPSNVATRENIPTDVSQLSNGAGYQTLSQVKTEISGSKIRTDQIECTDLNAFGATIGGFTIDNNSLNSSMSSTTNRILLCSGTSARYTVCGHSSTGWSLIAGSNFGVLKNGTMYASNANISGTLTTGATDGGKEFGVTVGDGVVHVKSNAFYDIPTDSGQVYLLMKFDDEWGHTWGLFASGPYVPNENSTAEVELKSLYVERIDRIG